jgi:hypothetical protein
MVELLAHTYTYTRIFTHNSSKPTIAVPHTTTTI